MAFLSVNAQPASPVDPNPPLSVNPSLPNANSPRRAMRSLAATRLRKAW